MSELYAQNHQRFAYALIAILIALSFSGYPAQAQQTQASPGSMASASAQQAPSVPQRPPSMLKNLLGLGPGIFWLGFLFGYFLVYSINAGSAASDALKSFLGVLGIGSGGLLALLPTSSDTFDIANRLADSTSKLAGSLQAVVGNPAAASELFQHLTNVLETAAQNSEVFQQQLAAAKTQLLSSYAHGAILGFTAYVTLALALASLYARSKNRRGGTCLSDDGEDHSG